MEHDVSIAGMDAELSARWLERLIDAGVVAEAEPEPKIVCCCSPPFEHEGILYTAVDAGCREHGIKSRYMSAVGRQIDQSRSRTVGVSNSRQNESFPVGRML